MCEGGGFAIEAVTVRRYLVRGAFFLRISVVLDRDRDS